MPNMMRTIRKYAISTRLIIEPPRQSPKMPPNDAVSINKNFEKCDMRCTLMSRVYLYEQELHMRPSQVKNMSRRYLRQVASLK